MTEPASSPKVPERGLLELLREQEVISSLDFHFARLLSRMADSPEEVLVCGALASRAIQLGHVCVELARIADRSHFELDETSLGGAHWPELAQLRQALRDSPLCSDGATAATPLVLDSRDRLYLQRYESYERSLAAALSARARRVSDVDLELLAQGLDRLFPVPSGAKAEGEAGVQTHRLLASVATLHHLAVICGGPGTGKTTTVVKVLALLQEQALAQGKPALEIALLAPTGKAARRLAEAVSNGAEALALPDAVRAAIPRDASTIHRALGGTRRVSGRFGHDASRPLSADVVVVDEVSMVDLALLYRLVSAIRPDARLILQGDKDQLASVEAGAILGDIYDARAARAWSVDFASVATRVTGGHVTGSAVPALCDCLVNLEQSYRYGKDSSIGRLARAINAGDVDRALGELERSPHGELDCQWLEPLASALGQRSALVPIAERTVAGYAAFIRAADPRQKLERLSDYRILCAHRQGPRGVTGLNHEVECWLADAGLIEPGTAFYENRPIIVTQNDYALGLFNGDVGVVVKDEAGRLRVCFESAAGLRMLTPGRLPPHETVFATTIHKSQGSEFDAVAVVLPDTASPLLGRELLYTAVTRARRRVDLFARREVLRTALTRSVQRPSGLKDRLWSALG